MRVKHALHRHISNQVTMSPPQACIPIFSREDKLMTDVGKPQALGSNEERKEKKVNEKHLDPAFA